MNQSQSQLRNRKRKQSPETKSTPETKSPEKKATSNNFAAPPVIPTMNRIGHNIIQNPSAAKCAECCSRTGKIVSGAAVGATLGACAGCVCAEDIRQKWPASIASTIPIDTIPIGTGLAGAVIGATVGPSKCLELGRKGCKTYQDTVYGGGKKKTRKRKQKKRRKTHKTKRKNKKRRSRKSNKSRRSKHLRKRKTRKNKKKSHKK